MVGFKQWRGGGDGMKRKEKSKNILMFEKRVEMNKIRYGGIRGGKLVIVGGKVIAWSHVMLCMGAHSMTQKLMCPNTELVYNM